MPEQVRYTGGNYTAAIKFKLTSTIGLKAKPGWVGLFRRVGWLHGFLILLLNRMKFAKKNNFSAQVKYGGDEVGKVKWVGGWCGAAAPIITLPVPTPTVNSTWRNILFVFAGDLIYGYECLVSSEKISPLY